MFLCSISTFSLLSWIFLIKIVFIYCYLLCCYFKLFFSLILFSKFEVYCSLALTLQGKMIYLASGCISHSHIFLTDFLQVVCFSYSADLLREDKLAPAPTSRPLGVHVSISIWWLHCHSCIPFWGDGRPASLPSSVKGTSVYQWDQGLLL